MINLTFTLNNKTCHIISQGTSGPVFLWPFSPEHGSQLQEMIQHLDSVNQDYILAAFSIEDWNRELSPWKAPAAFGNEDFGGEAAATLNWIKDVLLPYLQSNIPAVQHHPYYLMGYSLAGLFALWGLYESDLFSGAVCCSSSLWIQGWDQYAQTHHVNHPAEVYLSLGGKEEKTKNPAMALVGDRTRTQYQLLQNDSFVRRCTLEWNPGGHFTDPVGRLAKGIRWITM